MNRELALEVLGFKSRSEGVSINAASVNAAFRREVMKHHPDTQPQELKRMSALTIDEIKDARDFLLKNLSGNADFTCKLCSGLGMVRAKIGWLKCSACKGTGEKR